MNQRKPLLIIVSSPSGAGKTTLCKKLLAEFSDIRFSISHTTRPPRPNEVNGKDYMFTDKETFDQMVDDEQFVEWAHVHGNRYGTSHGEIRAAAASGVDLIFDVDYQGAKQIKNNYPDAIGVFILPPSIDELKLRLNARGTETPKSLETRFKAALGEIAHFDEFDYLLVNDDVNHAYDRLRAILLSERIKKFRCAHHAKRLLE
ncbi:MAG: guanylate kinase [Deltaproteobacteria bacterium]|nr:guanylate kinase [Deltaproteobacteria bacterium]MBN2671702.1 guanylate kinase [Deltaproteobacteria bacterium]